MSYVELLVISSLYTDNDPLNVLSISLAYDEGLHPSYWRRYNCEVEGGRLVKAQNSLIKA